METPSFKAIAILLTIFVFLGAEPEIAAASDFYGQSKSLKIKRKVSRAERLRKQAHDKRVRELREQRKKRNKNVSQLVSPPVEREISTVPIKESRTDRAEANVIEAEKITFDDSSFGTETFEDEFESENW